MTQPYSGDPGDETTFDEEGAAELAESLFLEGEGRSETHREYHDSEGHIGLAHQVLA